MFRRIVGIESIHFIDETRRRWQVFGFVSLHGIRCIVLDSTGLIDLTRLTSPIYFIGFDNFPHCLRFVDPEQFRESFELFGFV